MMGANGFLAWVRAVLRRPPTAAAPPPVWRFGSVVIDSSTRTVTKNDKEVRLSRAEYGLLLRLIKQAGSVVEQRALLEEVLGPPEQLESKYLRMFVQGLRMKLEDDPDHPQLIVRVGCRGYRLGGPPGTGSGEAVRPAAPPPD
jgi:two-component system, OmpR family, KDP operon response regulator KdpE